MVAISAMPPPPSSRYFLKSSRLLVVVSAFIMELTMSNMTVEEYTFPSSRGSSPPSARLAPIREDSMEVMSVLSAWMVMG